MLAERLEDYLHSSASK